MSSKPCPQGAERVIQILQRIHDIDQHLPSLREAYKKLKDLTEEKNKLDNDLGKLLDSMDVDRPGNYGWEGRFSWLLSEVVRQLSRGEDHS